MRWSGPAFAGALGRTRTYAHGSAGLVRWAIDGRQRSKAFRTKAEADRCRSRLLVAAERGEVFDTTTFEPASWAPTEPPSSVFVWACRWIEEQWPEWQPRTRRSALEALARFVMLAVPLEAAAAPNGCRVAVQRSLVPGTQSPLSGTFARWVDRWSLALNELDPSLLADVERRLGMGDMGQPPLLRDRIAVSQERARLSAARRRATAASDRSVAPSPRGRSKRKAARRRHKIDGRRLPDPATIARILDSIPTHQPGSRTYQVMTAVCYFAGLRPSEVVMLRQRALELPEEGWGAIDVVEADIDLDESGDPKTGPRRVPIPPVLVAVLRDWLGQHAFAPDQLIFRTRTGRMPTKSNWSRAWHRALRQAGVALSVSTTAATPPQRPG